MFYKKMKDTYVLRLEIGEEIVESLKSFLRQTRVRSGYVTGIGACDYARVGVYKVAEKRYYEKEFRGEMEITSLVGNVSTMNGEEYVHVHINMADDTGAVHGGHLNEARISATAEIFIHDTEEELERFREESIGINLLRI